MRRSLTWCEVTENLVDVGVKVRLNIIIDVQTAPIRRARPDYPKAEVASHPLQSNSTWKVNIEN
jgi:hypothetical protein